MTAAENFAELAYPFSAIPEPGEVKEVADGVLWLRMTLPFRLNHINLYLLRDDDGWVIVDTGIRGRETRQSWERIFQDVLGSNPVKRVIVTHMHPDHVGQAGWLTRHFGVELWMSRIEFLTCKMLAVDGPADMPEDAVHFYQRAGFNADQIDLYRHRFGRFGALIEPLPAGYRRLEDGDRLEIGGKEWLVAIGRGHSPAHACLVCDDLGLMISGDQVLPRISSNVSVFPTEPAANPLREWLASCRELSQRTNPDLLVLPSHNEPFFGLHRRLLDLIDGHEEGLSKLHEMCASPRRAIDVFSALFKSEVVDETLIFATGESLAHINYMLERGELAAETGPDGVAHYLQAAARASEPGSSPS